MIGATVELETRDSVCRFTNESQSGLDGVAPAPMESIVEHPLISTVRRSLRQTGYLELRNLHVTVNVNCVTLDGRVPSYFLKQLAQSAATRVPGIDRLINAVEVINCR